MTEHLLDMNSYQTIYAFRDKQGMLQDEMKTKIMSLPMNDFIVTYHSSKRARKDAHDRQKDLERIKKYIL